MATNIFQSNNAFIACEELAQKDAFYTTQMTGSIVSAAQSSAFNVSLDHIAPKQIGTSRLAFNSLNRQPDVGLQFSYYQNYPYFNEGFVNLVDINNATVTGMDEVPSIGALSGLENASRNFYILTRPDQGFDAFSGFVEGGSPSFDGYQCASVGNCYLTDYSLSYAVGGLPTVSVQFLGSNMQYEEVTGQILSSPAINLEDGNAENVGHLTFDGIREFDQSPIIMNPTSTGSSVTLQNLQVGGQALSGNHALQSVEFNLNIPRVASYGLGSDYVYNRKMQLPARGTLNVSSLVSGFSAGVLSGVLGDESDYDFDLVLEGSGNKHISYKIEDAKLQSYDYSMQVNGNMSLNASFAFELYPNPRGLQIEGNPQESLAYHCEQQIASRITMDELSIDNNGKMLVNFTDPDGSLTDGGYGAARSGDFWGKDIDFTSVSVWNNKGTDGDYRMRGGVAITKRHMAWSKNYMLSDGNTVWFVEPDGTWISRTIQEGRVHSLADIAVGLLDSDLPDTITPSKTLPSNINTYTKRDASENIDEQFRPICVGFDHEKKGLLMQGLYLNAEVTYDTNQHRIASTEDSPSSVPYPFNALAEILEEDDSGCPCFVIIDGTAVLLTTWWHPTADGSSYPPLRDDINDLIAGVDSDAGIDTGYQLEALDLTPFNFKRYPPL